MYSPKKLPEIKIKKGNSFSFCKIVWFQKIFLPSPQRVIGNSKGQKLLKAKIFKEKYEPKLEFPEGWGFNPKNPLWGEYGYFLEKHILKN